jgi:AmiR/NasT family two-component response regulator
MTTPPDRTAEDVVSAAVAAILETRAVIEQAKGMLIQG